jgi:hypothetical protein
MSTLRKAFHNWQAAKASKKPELSCIRPRMNVKTANDIVGVE